VTWNSYDALACVQPSYCFFRYFEFFGRALASRGKALASMSAINFLRSHIDIFFKANILPIKRIEQFDVHFILTIKIWAEDVIFGDFTSSCKKYRNLCIAILFKRPLLHVRRKRTPETIEKKLDEPDRAPAQLGKRDN
jgi:hypothetical protein